MLDGETLVARWLSEVGELSLATGGTADEQARANMLVFSLAASQDSGVDAPRLASFLNAACDVYRGPLPVEDWDESEAKAKRAAFRLTVFARPMGASPSGP